MERPLTVDLDVIREKGKYKRMPIFGPKLPRYRNALEATSKTSIFLGNIDLSNQVATLWLFYCKSQRDYGLRETVKILKDIHSEALRFATDTPFEINTSVWISRSKSGTSKGFPNFLKTFVPLLKSKNVLEVRMALSLLKCYECIVLPIKENIDSIITDSKGPVNYSKIQGEFKQFLNNSPTWREFYRKEFQKQKRRSKAAKVDFHYTTKKGINGPSAGTAGLQSLALNDDLIKKISSVSDTFYDEKFEPLIRENQDYYRGRVNDISGIPKKPELLANRIGRLAFVADKGGKTRTVAIGNYWIQNALYPLHKTCFNTLKYVGSDGTFDQITQFENVRYASTLGPVWSFDLTTATDRIPLVLDIDVLKSLDIRLGKTWGEIFTNYPFEYRGQTIMYKVGQPMGLYSSWALLALGHHAIILYCAHCCGIERPFTEYAIIGDDVAIWNKEVALKYRSFMEYLDIPISKQKSFVPKNDKGPCSAEFAKRISHNGLEITGISPDISIECWKSYILFPEYIAWLAIHNFSEATSAEFSKAIKLMRLTPHQISDCLSLFRINRILGGPTINLDGLDTNCIPEEIRNLDCAKLAQIRLSLLAERCSDEVDYAVHSSRTEEVELELLHLTNSSKNIVFRRILESSILRYDRLRDGFLDESFETIEDPEDVDDFVYINIDVDEPATLRLKSNFINGSESGQGDLISVLKTIEYLPPVKLKDLIDGLTSHDKTYIRRGRYIRDLFKHRQTQGVFIDQFMTDIEILSVRMHSLRITADIAKATRAEQSVTRTALECE